MLILRPVAHLHHHPEQSWSMHRYSDMLSKACPDLAGIGMLIEFWKITKVMNVTIESNPGQMPRLKFENRSSYINSNTKKWDDEATRYMMYFLTPCVIGYFIYSLLYDKHKNWCAREADALHGKVAALMYTDCFGEPASVDPEQASRCSASAARHSSVSLCASNQRPSVTLQVLFHTRNRRRLRLRVPVRTHVPAAVPELQAQVSCAPALAPNDLQIPEHHRGRLWRFHHQSTFSVPSCCVSR